MKKILFILLTLPMTQSITIYCSQANESKKNIVEKIYLLSEKIKSYKRPSLYQEDLEERIINLEYSKENEEEFLKLVIENPTIYDIKRATETKENIAVREKDLESLKEELKLVKSIIKNYQLS